MANSIEQANTSYLAAQTAYQAYTSAVQNGGNPDPSLEEVLIGNINVAKSTLDQLSAQDMAARIAAPDPLSYISASSADSLANAELDRDSSLLFATSLFDDPSADPSDIDGAISSAFLAEEDVGLQRFLAAGDEDAMTGAYADLLTYDGIDTTALSDNGFRDVIGAEPYSPSTSSPTGFVDASGAPVNVPEIPEVDAITVTAAKKDTRPVDHRIRIRAKAGNIEKLYTGTSAILKETNGVIFPYTPLVTFANEAVYSQIAPTHANQDYYFYSYSPAVRIQITGDFTAQNMREAQYMIACKQFFQAVTKMRFGDKDEQRGLPPPVVLLSGYGEHMFNDLPVIITRFSMDLPNTVDYVKVDIEGDDVWVPSMTTFNIDAVVQTTAKKQREFNWDEYASGSLLKKKGWI